MTAIESRQLRDACGLFGTGVNVITTHCDGQDHGMTANAFMSVSLDPPLIAISIAEKAKALGRIQKSGRFAVSVLAAGMEDLAWHFAGKPKTGVVECFERRDGLPVIKGAVATFVTDVADEVLAGDHSIFVGRVRALTHDPEGKPLLFFRGRFGALADPHPAPVLTEHCSYELMW
jgi:flavin reductase (DIM6/NTAB) family NADH-FMN oxidoreductase RutF